MKAILIGLIALAWSAGALAAEGVSSATEPPPGAQSFRELDSNRDGRLTFSEAFPNPRVANSFNQLDQNADGFLSPLEFGLAQR